MANVYKGRDSNANMKEVVVGGGGGSLGGGGRK